MSITPLFTWCLQCHEYKTAAHFVICDTLSRNQEQHLPKPVLEHSEASPPPPQVTNINQKAPPTITTTNMSNEKEEAITDLDEFIRQEPHRAVLFHDWYVTNSHVFKFSLSFILYVYLSINFISIHLNMKV